MCPDPVTQLRPRSVRPLCRQRGLGLIAAIFVVTVLALIAVGLTNLTVTAQQSYATEMQASRAFLAAQSGLELELNRLLPPSLYPDGHADLIATSGCLSLSGSTQSYSFSGAGLNGCSAEVLCQTVSAASASQLMHRLASKAQCGTGADQVIRQVSTVFQSPMP